MHVFFICSHCFCKSMIILFLAILHPWLHSIFEAMGQWITLGLNHFITKKILPPRDAYGVKIYVTTVILPPSIKSEVWPFLRNHHLLFWTWISKNLDLKPKIVINSLFFKLFWHVICQFISIFHQKIKYGFKKINL